jgi:hypothetical protein
VIKFVSDLRQVGGCFPDPPVSSTNKPDRHDINDILLKLVLNIIKQTKSNNALVSIIDYVHDSPYYDK